MTPSNHTARAEVEAVIERYREGFANLDADTLASLWDREYDDLVYVALEETRPRRSWQDISDYYAKLAVGFPPGRVATMRLMDLSVTVLGETAHAFCRFRFAAEAYGDEPPFAVEGRASFILRQCETGWRLIHYHESAPAGAGENAA